MSSFGQTIRKIRLNKGMTQKEVYLNIVTRSFYSKFERGEYDISASKFKKMLENLSLTFDEFLFIHYGNKKRSTELDDQYISDLYYSGDHEELLKLYEKYRFSPLRQEKIVALDIYMLIFISSDNYKRMSREPALELKEYLKNIQQWTLQELKLYIFTVSRYFHFFGDMEEMNEFIEKAIYSLEEYKEFNLQKYYHYHSRLLLEQLMIMVIAKEFDQAKQFFNRMKKIIQDSPSTDDKVGLKAAEIILGVYQDPKYYEEAERFEDTLAFLQSNDKEILCRLISNHKKLAQGISVERMLERYL